MNNTDTSQPEKRILEINVEGKAYAVDIDEPRTIQELCFFMRRNPTYISAMRRAGYSMPFDPIDRCHKSSIREYKAWLTDHPNFSFHRAYKKSNDRTEEPSGAAG